MTRWIEPFNLLGVLALATLCGFQWQTNRSVNLEVHAMAIVRQELEVKLDERDRKIKGCAADLDSFRQQVTLAKTELEQTETRSSTTARAVAQAAHERDALKTSVADWAKAMTARDAELQAVGAQLRALAAERNDVVTKLNDLGEKYHQVVQTLNERTRQLNELAEKYEKARAP